MSKAIEKTERQYKTPPSLILPKEEFEKKYPGLHPPSHLLVCSACDRTSSGNKAADAYPPWILVTWLCHPCRLKAQGISPQQHAEAIKQNLLRESRNE